MQTVDNLLNFYSSSLSNRLAKLSQPLADCFHLNGFFYSYTGEDGNFYQICNQPALAETYFANHLYRSNPFICHTNNYKHNQKIISSDFAYQAFYDDQRIVDAKHGMSNFLIIYKKEPVATHVLMYTSNEKDLPLNTLFLENQTVLDRYSEYFLKEWAPHQESMKKYMLDIKQLMGKRYQELDIGFKNAFHKKLGHEKFMKKIGTSHGNFEEFTARELDCIHYFLLGQSASEIAASLNLSPRTVEHYFNNIKLKTNCFKKSHLFATLQEYKNFNLI